MRMEKLSRRPVVAILGAALRVPQRRSIWRNWPEMLKSTLSSSNRVRPSGVGSPSSTVDPAHRLNVPASRMSIHAEKPSHFVEWLSATSQVMSPGTATLEGELFPERQIFGSYVAAQLDPLIASGAVRHVRAHGVSVAEAEDRFLIELSDETSFDADMVVLAMSHLGPAFQNNCAASRGLSASSQI